VFHLRADRDKRRHLDLPGVITGTTDRVDNIAVGRMSPLTATAFLLAALALLLELPPLSQRWWCRQIASLLALAVSSISFVAILSYAAGAPLLYGTRTIPMALLTDVSFAPIVLGLLIAAGIDTFPIVLFQTEAGVGSKPLRDWGIGTPVLAFLLLLVGIGTVGYAYFKHQNATARQVAQDNLSSIADLKASQIAAWYQERLADGRDVFNNPAMQARARELLAGAGDARAKEELLSWMQFTLKQHGYHSVASIAPTARQCLACRSSRKLRNHAGIVTSRLHCLPRMSC